MIKRNVSLIAVAVVAASLFFSCATRVGQIARNPQSYSGKTLRIKGAAGKGFSIPLTDISVFLLHGETTSVPVVAMKEPRQGQSLVVRGTVWAFPEEGMSLTTSEAVRAVEDFLVDQKLVSAKKARDASALILTAVGKLSRGLGHVWFVIEQPS